MLQVSGREILQSLQTAQPSAEYGRRAIRRARRGWSGRAWKAYGRLHQFVSALEYGVGHRRPHECVGRDLVISMLENILELVFVEACAEKTSEPSRCQLLQVKGMPECLPQLGLVRRIESLFHSPKCSEPQVSVERFDIQRILQRNGR